mmetsp:Transcript_1940/g.2905  ORF Transcript_1940/g.2905 Transcript_1940/m.2905 type:complete len:230 (+) Transcript_1940:583-1272(+)
MTIYHLQRSASMPAILESFILCRVKIINCTTTQLGSIFTASFARISFISSSRFCSSSSFRILTRLPCFVLLNRDFLQVLKYSCHCFRPTAFLLLLTYSCPTLLAPMWDSARDLSSFLACSFSLYSSNCFMISFCALDFPINLGSRSGFFVLPLLERAFGDSGLTCSSLTPLAILDISFEISRNSSLFREDEAFIVAADPLLAGTCDASVGIFRRRSNWFSISLWPFARA